MQSSLLPKYGAVEHGDDGVDPETFSTPRSVETVLQPATWKRPYFAILVGTLLSLMGLALLVSQKQPSLSLGSASSSLAEENGVPAPIVFVKCDKGISQGSCPPTTKPTAKPTMQPSLVPTSQPTRRPSRQPSTGPTSQPSFQPTSDPSSRPSMQPTEQPTIQPSRQPSTNPSSQPFARPSCQPSMMPSDQP